MTEQEGGGDVSIIMGGEWSIGGHVDVVHGDGARDGVGIVDKSNDSSVGGDG